jgi:predicted MFS family arabinose efflux permease
MHKTSAEPTREIAERLADRAVSSPQANYALAVLTLIYVLNYADRTVLSLLLDSIKKEFRLSDTVMGLISGFGFVLFYSLLGLPVARWADRFNRRFILTAGLAVWSAATCCSGLARNGWQLALTRFGVGAGEAGGIAPSHSMLADLFPKEKLPRALAILTAGSQIGVFVGAILAGYVNQHYGWRMAFFAAGLPGIAVAILFRLTVKEPARGAMEGRRANVNLFTIAQTAGFLFRQRSFVLITLGGSLMGITFYGFQVWTPAFLHRVRHLSSATIGTYTGIVSGVFGVAGVLLGGFLAERLGKRDVRWRVYVPAVAAALAAPADLLFLFLPSLHASFIFWALAFVFTAAYQGPTYAIYQTVSKVRMRAVASATFLFFGNIIGLGVGSWFIGILSDSFRPQDGDEAIRYALAAASLIALLAGALFWVGSRYLAQDIDTAEAP